MSRGAIVLRLFASRVPGKLISPFTDTVTRDYLSLEAFCIVAKQRAVLISKKSTVKLVVNKKGIHLTNPTRDLLITISRSYHISNLINKTSESLALRFIIIRRRKIR